MKTPCTRACSQFIRHLVLDLSLLALASAALMSINATAAGFISVPSTGVGPLTFDLVATPTPTNGFSTQSIVGAGNSINDVVALDTSVQTNEIANINLVLPQSNTQPPSTSGFARYNYGGFFLQLRTTGNAYAELLGTFRNDSGTDRSVIILGYDQGFAQSGGTEQVPGLNVYYSLTGAAGTWHKLDGLSGREGTFSMATNVPLVGTWEVGANLYILWVDDNGDGFTDGDFTIDNLSLSFEVTPPAIQTQPHDITFQACQSSNLSVVVTGTGPFGYQWFKGGAAINGATSSTLAFNNAIPSDSAIYWVVVTGPGGNNPVESAHVTVTVNEDVVPPTVISAVGLINGTNVVITFSEKMDTNFALFANPIDGSAYHLVASGSGDIPEDAIMATINGADTVVTISFANPRTPNTLYDLLIDPTVSDCRGNPLTGDNVNGNGQIVVPLEYEIVIMAFDNTPWVYNHDGVDFGLDWLDPGFDDSTWSNGVSVFDAKSTPRTTVGGKTVATQLPLHNPTGPYVTDDIPVYYFRTHFTLPVGLSHISALELRTFVDDFDVAYFNGSQTPAHVRAGLLAAPDFFGYAGGTAVGDAGVEGPFNIPLSNLADGQNFLAVKMFQQAVGSSDITFAYELTAVVDAFPSSGPSLTISRDPGTGAVSLTWPAGSGAQLYEANSVDAAGGAWSLVAGAADGSYSFTPGATGQKFYTLRQ
jgi:hypothetical protein